MTEEKSSIHPYALGLATLSALARLLPHPYNFTPVGAASLFSGARLNGWLAYLLPIAVMAATDPFVGGYSSATPFVYAAFLVNVLIGRSIRSTNSPLRIGTAALLCSVQFFVVTNFAIFLAYFPHTPSGLAACYWQAVPYFGRTLAGDLTWTAVIFGVHYMAARTIAPKERVAATA